MNELTYTFLIQSCFAIEYVQIKFILQVKLSDSFRQASSKIGNSFGMRLAAAAAEEEAARAASGQMGHVELAEVHHPVAPKKASEENLDGLSLETQ